MERLLYSMIGEWKAALAVTLLAGALIIAAGWKTSGPVSLETASVARFGSYSDDLGNHPTVILRFDDGSTLEVKSTPAFLRGCAVGKSIALVTSIACRFIRGAVARGQPASALHQLPKLGPAVTSWTVKKVQIIDGAADATFSLFQATEEEFAAILPDGRDKELIDDLVERLSADKATRLLAPFFDRLILKREAAGLHGTLLYDSEHRDPRRNARSTGMTGP